MANTVDVKIIQSGPKNLTLLVFLQSDGATGELDKHTIVDPVADLGLTSKDRLVLVKVDHALAGFEVILEFDAGGVTPNMKWVLTESGQSTDFCSYGYIRDDSGLDGTGKLMLSTVGFTSSADVGSILLQIRKQ